MEIRHPDMITMRMLGIIDTKREMEMINRCRQGCPNNEYIDRNWVCTAIDWAEDNEPGFVVQKFRILDTKQPTPEWCPLEEK